MYSFLVADFHTDVLSASLEQDRLLTEEGAVGQVDLPRMERGGVGLAVFALFPFSGPHRDPWANVRQQLLLARSLAAARWIRLLRKKRHLLAVSRTYRPKVVLSLEGACPLAPEGRYQRERLALLARWGVRLVNLTWNYNNPFASAAVEQDQYGLTPLGRALLADMNHHRMLLDVSHLAERSFWEAIEQTRLPPVASHSNAKSLCDHPRNLSTSQIKAIAQRKGVIGVNFCPAFLSSTRQATIDDVIRHIDYLLEVVGEEAVAIGTDFDGISRTPVGLADVAMLPQLIQRLRARGYAPAVLEKLLWRNVWRVLGLTFA